MKKPKVLYLVTEDWYFCSHRLQLACSAQKAGYEVVVMTRVSSHGDEIKRHGFKLVPINLRRTIQNPIYEIVNIFELVKHYRHEKPCLVHHVAMKPVLYGSIAAWIAKVPFTVNALAGLGYLFLSDNMKAKLLRPAVRVMLRGLLSRKNSRVVLQNPDDRSLLISERVLRQGSVSLIRSSGVDVKAFPYCSQSDDSVPIVILASRMLWDKGVGEYISAVRILQRKGLVARFVLVGDSDPENPASIPGNQLQEWHDEGIVEWWGRRDDMPYVMRQASIVCLPSYREGLPKVLLEAAASGRAIVSCDAPGCREIVRDGVNGLLVPIRNSELLAEALERLITDPSLRRRMGRYGRRLVEQEFSSDRVIQETLALYGKCHDFN